MPRYIPPLSHTRSPEQSSLPGSSPLILIAIARALIFLQRQHTRPTPASEPGQHSPHLRPQFHLIAPEHTHKRQRRKHALQWSMENIVSYNNVQKKEGVEVMAAVLVHTSMLRLLNHRPSPLPVIKRKVKSTRDITYAPCACFCLPVLIFLR